MNRTELAREFNVSLTTIDSWIRNGMPCITQGGPGKKWKFNLDQVAAWREENYPSSSISENPNITMSLVNCSVGAFAAWLANHGHLKKNTIQNAIDLTKKWITSGK